MRGSEAWRCGKVGELFLLGCRLCSILRVTVTCECAFQMTPSTCPWNSICCGKEAQYDASAMKFRLSFYVGFLTRQSPHWRNRRIRCPYPFRLFFCGVPNHRQPTCSKFFFTTVKRVHACVSRAIAKRSSWVKPGRERNGNVMWQSHNSCFSLLFFPWCSTWVNVLPFKIKMTSFSKAKAAGRQAQRWAIFLHRGVCSSLGWVMAKRESWAEQEEFENFFHHSETSSCMCESSDREAIELGKAREGAKRQCYVAVSQ